MLVRSRRSAALAVGAALLGLATACTNPTAPSATPRHTIPTVSGDGVIIGGSGATVAPPAPKTADGVIIGGSG